MLFFLISTSQKSLCTSRCCIIKPGRVHKLKSSWTKWNPAHDTLHGWRESAGKGHVDTFIQKLPEESHNYHFTVRSKYRTLEIPCKPAVLKHDTWLQCCIGSSHFQSVTGIDPSNRAQYNLCLNQAEVVCCLESNCQMYLAAAKPPHGSERIPAEGGSLPAVVSCSI